MRALSAIAVAVLIAGSGVMMPAKAQVASRGISFSGLSPNSLSPNRGSPGLIREHAQYDKDSTIEHDLRKNRQGPDYMKAPSRRPLSASFRPQWYFRTVDVTGSSAASIGIR